MRVGVSIAVLCAGCGTDYYLDLSPRFDAPVGLELTVDVYADVVGCHTDGFDEEVCSNDQTEGLDVALDGTAIELGPAATTYSDFTVTGIAVGMATLSIDGDHAGRDVAVQVQPVAASELYVQRWGGASALPNEHSPVATFTDASLIVGQVHRDATDRALLGHASLVLAPGPTGTTVGEYGELVVGPTAGRATLETAVGGEMVVDVVDGSAIDAFEIHWSYSTDPLDRIELSVGDEVNLFLRPFDVDGRTITGRGPVPTIAVPPLYATVEVEDRFDGDTRAIAIVAIEPGTAVAQVAWGARTKDLTIVIR